MKFGNVYVCNVCGIKSNESEDAVFIKAHKNGDSVHICTDCMPSVIHGSGKVVKSNSELETEIFNAYSDE